MTIVPVGFSITLALRARRIVVDGIALALDSGQCRAGRGDDNDII